MKLVANLCIENEGKINNFVQNKGSNKKLVKFIMNEEDIMNEEAPAKNTVWVLWSNWFW